MFYSTHYFHFPEMFLTVNAAEVLSVMCYHEFYRGAPVYFHRILFIRLSLGTSKFVWENRSIVFVLFCDFIFHGSHSVWFQFILHILIPDDDPVFFFFFFNSILRSLLAGVCTIRPFNYLSLYCSVSLPL